MASLLPCSFYIMSDESNAVVKKPIHELSTMVNLLDDTDLMNPILELKMELGGVEDAFLPIVSSVNTQEYNYFKLLGRYYFITSKVIVRQNLIRITGHMDVLYSYNKEILNLDAFIARSETHYNKYLRDPLRPFEAIRQIEYYQYDSKFIKPWSNDDYDTTVKAPVLIVNVGNTYRQVIAGVAGDRFNGKLTTYPSAAYSPYAKSLKTYLLVGTDVINDFMSFLMSDEGGSQAASYITSMFLSPFGLDTDNYSRFGARITIASPTTAGEFTFMKIGNIDFKKNVGADYKGSSYEITGGYIGDTDVIDVTSILKSFPNDYSAYEPYTDIHLYVPFYGYVSIPINKLMNHVVDLTNDTVEIMAVHKIDPTSGNDAVDILVHIQVNSITSSFYEFIDTISMPILIPLPITASTADSVIRQSIANTMSLIGNAMNAFMNMAGGAMTASAGAALSAGTGGVGGAGMASAGMGQMLGGLGGLVSAGSTFIGQQVTNVPFGTIADASSNFVSECGPMLYIVAVSRANPLDSYSAKFLSVMGAPVQAIHKLSEMSGFTVIGEVHIENIVAIEPIREEIERLLKAGVFLP